MELAAIGIALEGERVGGLVGGVEGDEFQLVEFVLRVGEDQRTAGGELLLRRRPLAEQAVVGAGEADIERQLLASATAAA